MEIEAATFMVEGVEVSRAILGCDPFILWLHEDDDSPFSAREAL